MPINFANIVRLIQQLVISIKMKVKYNVKIYTLILKSNTLRQHAFHEVEVVYCANSSRHETYGIVIVGY